MDAVLSRIYFNPKKVGSYGGAQALWQAAQPHRIPLAYVKQWLSKQEAYTLHKDVRSRFPREKTYVDTYDQQYQTDLIDVRRLANVNEGFNYLLTIIDCFSRYAWAIPIRNKKPESVRDALKMVFSERRPVKLQSDRGGEFLGKAVQVYLKKEGITFFTTSDDVSKASIVERFHRTLKRRLVVYFEKRNTHRYIDVLPKLIHSYNHTRHSAIKMTPASVNSENYQRVWRTLYGDLSPPNISKFHVGDTVRISRHKTRFEKGHDANWTRELFEIVTVKKTHRPLYEIKDLNDELIEGTFYESQLQKVVSPSTFKVEKVLRKRRRHGKQEYFVKWMGYPATFNSWTDQMDVI